MLKDEETMNEFKANAYERAKDFDIGKVVCQYEVLYSKLLNL